MSARARPLPLPAFARELADARKRGLTLADRRVSVVLHWRARPRTGYGVVVADDTDPAALDWTWARGLDVMIWRRGDAPQRLLAAVRAIGRCRPRRLLVIDLTDSRFIAFVEHHEVSNAA